MSIQEQRRKAFEAWVTRKGEVAKNIKMENGFYKLIWVQQSWVAWQAALDSACVDIPATIAATDEWRKGYNTGVLRTEEAIHAAGVKTK